MIHLILTSNMWTLLGMVIAACFLFLLGIVLIAKKTPKKISTPIHDVSAIAGEDLIATQLDLARALIEANQKDTAKHILKIVLQQGSNKQRQEAHHLLLSSK